MLTVGTTFIEGVKGVLMVAPAVAVLFTLLAVQALPLQPKKALNRLCRKQRLTSLTVSVTTMLCPWARAGPESEMAFTVSVPELDLAIASPQPPLTEIPYT